MYVTIIIIIVELRLLLIANNTTVCRKLMTSSIDNQLGPGHYYRKIEVIVLSYVYIHNMHDVIIIIVMLPHVSIPIGCQ